MKIYGLNRPIFPILPPEESTLKFKAWEKAQRVPFIIYADFEALLEKIRSTWGQIRRVYAHPDELWVPREGIG